MMHPSPSIAGYNRAILAQQRLPRQQNVMRQANPFRPMERMAARHPYQGLAFSGQWATNAASVGTITVLGQARPLRVAALKNKVQRDSDPYIGQIPVAFQQALGLTEEQIFKGLDQMAARRNASPLVALGAYLLSFFNGSGSDSHFEELVKPRLIGQGSFGWVYKLGVGNQAVAFKIHIDGSRPIYDVHSAYQEAATGQFFAAHQVTKDVSRFYAANPKIGWSLTEYIDETASVANREGLTIQEAGLLLGDDHHKNRIAGIRVDFGGEVVPIVRRARHNFFSRPLEADARRRRDLPYQRLGG